MTADSERYKHNPQYHPATPSQPSARVTPGVALGCGHRPGDLGHPLVLRKPLTTWNSTRCRTVSSLMGPACASASAKGLNVGLSRPSKILVCDRRERHQIDLVDFDQHGTAPVDTSDLDLWSRPQAVGDGDGSARYSIAKGRAELHAAILSSDADAERARRGTAGSSSSTIAL